MSAPSTPPMFLLYADTIAGTPRDKSDGIAVDKRRTGRLLSIPLWAARSIRPWRMNIVFPGSTFASLFVDGIRLVDLIVPVRKVPVRNRALASSIDVKKLSQKHGINALKVHFPSTSLTQPRFPGRLPKSLA